MYINNDVDYLKFLKGKNVYIFGAGVKGKACVYKLNKEKIRIVGFIDNNKDLWKKKIENYPVISVDDFQTTEVKDAMIVICSCLYEREMKQQLLDRGIFNFISETQIDFGGGEEYYDEKYFEYQQKIGEFGGKVKLKFFAPHISKEDFVVDFGCGGGYLLSNIVAREKVGIEINETARKQAEKLGIKTVRSAEELENDSVDVVISSGALEHVENPLGILRDLYTKLKPGGKIVFHVPNERCETEYTRSEINNHLYTWNCLNLGNLFKAAGFFIYSVERIQTVWPIYYEQIKDEVSVEFFNELCLLEGNVYDENVCLIVAYK